MKHVKTFKTYIFATSTLLRKRNAAAESSVHRWEARMFVVRQDRQDDEPNNGLRGLVSFLEWQAIQSLIITQEFLSLSTLSQKT